MKKYKNEAQLVKKALIVCKAYAAKRGYAPIDEHISEKDKVEVYYRLLVNDKLIAALPSNKEDGPNFRHRLAIWLANQLPDDHPLKQ